MSNIEEKYKESREAPLYKATERLLWEVDDTLNYLCKDRRHTLGQHMLQIVLGMLDCISIAYDFPEQRVEQLRLYISKYNNLATILKMCENKGYMIVKGKNKYIDMIKHDRLYAGNRTVGNAYEVARGYDRVKNKEEYIEKFAQRYNSYMGYLIHKKSYAIRWDIWNEVADEAKQYVYMTNGLAVMKVRNRYKERNKLIECYGKKHRKQKRIRRDNSCIYPQ
jgi:hypothetical protein